MSALIGRARERAEIGDLLASRAARLVCLTGAPGIGKTRLATAVAADVGTKFRDGVRYVELAPLADPGLVLSAVSEALGSALAADQTVRQVLASQLRRAELLLVLDNFEHVQAAAADVAWLLDQCPGVSVLVTSRARLRLTDEYDIALSPLDPHSAVELFAQRAHAARADFAIGSSNADAVQEICTRLDGMPLAIELAAARIRVLSPAQIAERLENCLGLLARRDDDGPLRHRTLRAALDWTFDALGPRQQAMLRRLSVFAGGIELAAAAHVTDESEADFLQDMEELLDHALIDVREEAGEVRYCLLETVRQYARERLAEADEDAAACARHLAWYVTLAEQAEAELFGAEQGRWLERLGREHDNVRAALGWGLEHGDAQGAARLATAIWKFWEVRGHAREGLRWLEQALDTAHTLDPAARARAQHAAACLALACGEYDRAACLDEANIVLRESVGDRHGQAVSMLHLAMVARSRGDARAAIGYTTGCLALFRGLGDARWCANALTSHGMALFDAGDYPAARAALDEALTLFRQIGGTRRAAVALGNLGDVVRAEGNFDCATTYLTESLSGFADLNDAWGSSASLQSLALVALARGDFLRAARMLGAAEAQREAAGAVLAPPEGVEHERAVLDLRARIGREAMANAWAAGRSLSLDAAVDLASEPVAPTSPSVPLSLTLVTTRLSEREREVAALLARGLTNRQIADVLVITKQTTDKHVGNILGKLGMASRAQVAVWAVQHGLHQAKVAAAA